MPTTPPPTYTDLEIRILDREARGYPVEFTVDGRQFPRGYLDASALPESPGRDAADGEQLYRWLLADPGLKEAWDKAMGTGGQCRIRLRIDAAAPELHVLRWELLRQPAGSAGPAHDLAASDRTPFSRFPALPVAPGRQIVDEKLRVLVAIADPGDLDKYRLAAVDRAAEFQSLQEAVAGLPVELTLLAGPCTLSAIETALRRGYHALHFIGQGSYAEKRGPALFLAGRDNTVEPAYGRDLADMLARMAGPDNPLQLVFLGSCQTAETSPADAFRGLAPQLLQAGIPAVVAMQDFISIVTARAFARTFYSQLMQHGVVDLAANQARASLMTARLPGAAVPVLFMRVPDGRLLAIRDRLAPAAPPASGPTPPSPTTTLVGRDRFLDQLAGELIRPSGADRLALTALRGLPGVGKTALALALANRADVAAAFPDGRVWLPLGPGPDLFGALGRLLDLFNIPAGELLTVDARADRLRERLAGRRYLLLLDDVWATADGRPFVDACAPPARVLITTRFPQIAADLHAANHEVRTLQSKHAVAMLRGAGENAAAAVVADEQGAAELAGELGHLPLALHVAGRRLERLARADGPAGAVARLRAGLALHILSLPAGERRLGIEADEPALEAILALSYDALPDDDARRAFRRLAVFGSQPFDFDAAAMAAVWEVGEDQATDLRIALVDAGLLERVTLEATTGDRLPSGDGPRYSLHQVIAAFASLRLNGDPAEARSAALAHTRHYRDVFAGYDEAIQTGRMTYSAPLDWENVALALQRLADAWMADDEAAAILLVYARSWRNVLYNNHDPRRAGWLEAAKGAARRRGAPWELANVLQAQGDVLAFLDQRDEALARYQEALTRYRAVGDRLGEANVLQAQGQMTLGEGATQQGMELLDAARSLYLAVGDRVGVVNCGIILARYAAGQGDFDAAIEYMQPAADFGTEINHPVGPQLQAEIDGWKTQLVWQEAQGDPERLRPLLEQSIAEGRSNGDNAQLAKLAAALLQVCQHMEDWPAAASAAEELINLGAMDAGTWAALGDARSNQDDEAGATEAYVQAVALAPDNAMLRRNYANSLINLGRLDEAAVQLDAAETLEPGAPYLALRRAELAKARDDQDETVRWAAEALRRQPGWDEAQALLDWASDRASAESPGED